MPDMMNLRQPPHHAMMMRPAKESPRQGLGFPEYLKHADVLGEGAHMKLSTSNGLFHSVLKGRVRGTRMLLDRGCSVNGRNDYGYSILTAALYIDDDKRRYKMFRLLMDRGADPLFKDSGYQRSVLHWACLLGRFDQVKIILKEAGGDLDLKDKDVDSNTALHHAVMAGDLNIVTILVDTHRKFGVSVDIPDKMGLTPYLHAKRLGYRDVAEYLHTEGQASLGHGDMLFRTPREWSMIGKFERKKAIEINTQEAINFAKIRGKITHAKHLEGSLYSPRMAIPNIILPSYSPEKDQGVKLAIRHNHRISRSLPSLKDYTPRADGRPSSANGAGPDSVDAGSNLSTTAPGPIKEAFTHGPGASQATPRLTQGPLTSTHGASMSSVPGGSVSGAPLSSVPGGPIHGAPLSSVPGGTGLGVRNGPGSFEAFNLMEMNEKGRHARHYRQSQFDETKASEYKHMMGNLNSIMEVLAEQTSKSFRQSVKYQRPETPKKKKVKSKVSSLAVIFGRDKSGRKLKKSPKSSAKKVPKSGQKKEKGGGAEEKKSKAPPSEKKKAVPLLKVNDRVV